MDNNLIINNTNYSIEEQWLKLVGNYFPNEDLSMLKVGLFGYVNEIMANEIKNNTYHRNYIYDEHLLNTASTSKSIYNFAKTHNVEVETATPARLSANISFKKEDILNSSNFIKVETNNVQSANVYKFIISRNTKFLINEYSFIAPHDIQLLFTYNNMTKQYAITASYLIENNVFPYYINLDPFIKVWESSVGKDEYIYLKVELFQLYKKSKNILITNQEGTNNTFYKFNYDRQLAYFEVKYENDGKKEDIRTLFNDSYSLNNGEKYCYYNLLDNNTIELSFSSLHNNFKPKFNSNLIVDIYTTDGSNANFSNQENLVIKFNSDGQLDSIPMYIYPMTDCSKGKDQPTLLELKKKIVDTNLSRNTIITDRDLTNFFNNITITERVNSSFVKFEKKRDDILKRVYYSYLLLKDNAGMTIPTRTLENIKISKSQLEETNGIISERSIVVYDIAGESYFLVTKELELKKYINNPKYLLYTIPYLLEISNESVLNCNYYTSFLNESYTTKYRYQNPEIPYKFIMNTFTINRNSLEDDLYRINTSISTNMIINNSNENNFIVRGVLKDRGGKSYGYFDFKKISEVDLVYEAVLSTEKYNSIVNNKLNLYNSIYKIDSMPGLDNNGNTSYKNCYVDNEVLLDIQILYKSNMSGEKFEEANLMPDLILGNEIEQYSTAAVFTSINPIFLFKNRTPNIESIVIPNESNNGVTIKSIPLIEYNYMKINYMNVFDTLNIYENLLETNIAKLENNTNIDIKFFNTHGIARNYCSNVKYNSVKHTDEIYNIPRIDIGLDLDITLNKTISDSTKMSIENYISNFVENCNEDGLLPISNLTRKLETYYNEIKFIEVNGIDGQLIQKIVNRNNILRDKTNFVPEFLNIRKNIISTKIEDREEKSYKYDITINYK